VTEQLLVRTCRISTGDGGTFCSTGVSTLIHAVNRSDSLFPRFTHLEAMAALGKGSPRWQDYEAESQRSSGVEQRVRRPLGTVEKGRVQDNALGVVTSPMCYRPFNAVIARLFVTGRTCKPPVTIWS